MEQQASNPNAWKSAVRFIIADDEAPVRKLIIARLKQEGFKGLIYEASDGQQAYELFLEKEVDCIISDWNMPKLSGIEFVEKVRRAASIENLAILMVTGESTMGKIEEALDLGVSDYLVKPFTPEDFKRKIDKIMIPVQKKKMGSMGSSQG